MMFALPLLLALAPLPPSGQTPGPGSPPDPRTAAAVVAVDHAWGEAETRGDDAFVDWLLMPGYQSIGPTGRATGKAALVASARRNHDDAAAAVARSAEWKAEHPVRAEVALYGENAVVTWLSTKPGTDGLVSSCDIFVYRDGHWHPVYSQHSQLA